jgi:hypothetical protein
MATTTPPTAAKNGANGRKARSGTILTTILSSGVHGADAALRRSCRQEIKNHRSSERRRRRCKRRAVPSNGESEACAPGRLSDQPISPLWRAYGKPGAASASPQFGWTMHKMTGARII